MAPPIDKHTLARGQTLRLQLPAGARIVCLHGQVTAHPPPDWIAEHMLTTSCRLRDGESFCAASGGWIAIEARASAELALLPPLPGAIARAVVAAVAAMRRLIAGKAASEARAG